MEKIIVDGNEAVLGRMGSFVAKELLKGKAVDVINSENVILSGSKEYIVEKINQKRKMGSGASLKGPKYIRQTDRLLKRMIRGMLPWKTDRGRKAFKRVMCYLGVPNQYASQKLETLEAASVDRLSTGKYIELGRISARLGIKQDGRNI